MAPVLEWFLAGLEGLEEHPERVKAEVSRGETGTGRKTNRCREWKQLWPLPSHICTMRSRISILKRLEGT